jgi:hypothetical protein
MGAIGACGTCGSRPEEVTAEADVDVVDVREILGVF